MKKIICLLLALACMFAVVSCASKSEASIQDIINQNKPTKVTTLVSFAGAKTLNGKFINTIDNVNGLSIYEYDFERLAKVSEMNSGSIKSIQGKIYYKNGQISKNEGETWESTGVSEAVNFKLQLDERNFKTFEYTPDGNSVNATIAPENVQAVLGIAISTAEDVSVNIVTNGKYLNRITISYKTTDGAAVVVDTSYTYSPVTLNFDPVVEDGAAENQ